MGKDGWPRQVVLSAGATRQQVGGKTETRGRRKGDPERGLLPPSRARQGGGDGAALPSVPAGDYETPALLARALPLRFSADRGRL